MCLTSKWCDCLFYVHLIIAHELRGQECALLMAQQQIAAVIPNGCGAGLIRALLWLLS